MNLSIFSRHVRHATQKVAGLAVILIPLFPLVVVAALGGYYLPLTIFATVEGVLFSTAGILAFIDFGLYLLTE